MFHPLDSKWVNADINELTEAIGCDDKKCHVIKFHRFIQKDRGDVYGIGVSSVTTDLKPCTIRIIRAIIEKNHLPFFIEDTNRDSNYFKILHNNIKKNKK